jgi:hypothetical protein
MVNVFSLDWSFPVRLGIQKMAALMSEIDTSLPSPEFNFSPRRSSAKFMAEANLATIKRAQSLRLGSSGRHRSNVEPIELPRMAFRPLSATIEPLPRGDADAASLAGPSAELLIAMTSSRPLSLCRSADHHEQENFPSPEQEAPLARTMVAEHRGVRICQRPALAPRDQNGPRHLVQYSKPESAPSEDIEEAHAPPRTSLELRTASLATLLQGAPLWVREVAKVLLCLNVPESRSGE